MKIFANFIVVTALFVSCSSDKQTNVGLAFIDVTKNYPEKEIFLNDIAEVTYLYLNSDDDEYLYQSSFLSTSEHTVAVYDNSSGNILFFSKDGSPKSRFNHLGNGPGEYRRRPLGIVYNEVADELFVYDRNNIIQVYSSIGEHKRTITLPQEIEVNGLRILKDHSLFFHDGGISFKARIDALLSNQKFNGVPFHIFYRISQTNGEVIDSVKIPALYSETSIIYEGELLETPTNLFMKSSDGILLCSPGTDTVYLYRNDKTLVPVLYQIPSTALLKNPVQFIDICFDGGEYQFIKVITVRQGEVHAGIFPSKHYVRYKETGEIFSQKLLLSDYKDKEFIIDNNVSGGGKSFNEENTCFFELSLYELKQAYRENKLSGKLKELVATLNEDKDNNVFMLLDFK